MEPRSQKLHQIFSAAMELSGGERDAYIAEACGSDEDMQEEVKALLTCDQRAADTGFLEPHRMNVNAHMPTAEEKDPMLGEQVGNYVIKRRLGQGGMGNVYLAVRRGEYQQRIAIKVLKRGMDSEEIIRRFRNEVRVQAALSKHPNIAGLIDAGTTDDGLPYFVMEYVDGQRIDRYCDRHRLTTRERLALFRDVCAAVEFAHQHTVVHRDLKPSNVLVTDDGLVKLIDFGIAKLTTPELWDVTATMTLTEMRLLTPDFASPEQTRGDPVTTVSDVYSLGVLLYGLLSGRRPYQTANRTAREIENLVCEREPIAPSRAVTAATMMNGALDDDADHIARRRETTARKLPQQLSGDLDNIVLKAMRKEPSRRYASVEALSEDVRRHLGGLPVAARPVGGAERVWRACVRQPLVAAVFVAVLFGSVFGFWYLAREANELVQATALRAAAHEARIIEEVHQAYTDEVQRLETAGNSESADLLTPPAVFAKTLAARVGRRKAADDVEVVSRVFDDSDMYARLYSRFPFRAEDAPANEFPQTKMDEFERQALAFVENQPGKPYYRFGENWDGQPALRYVQARVMQKDCVECHNKPENRARNQHVGLWKVGDVGGAVEVIRPMTGDLARVRSELRGAFVMVAGISFMLLAACFVVFSSQRKAK